jgi:psp operon transcriptional activator
MSESPDLPPLIGESQPFLDLMDRVSRVAPLNRPVLVIGERGTGKELIAAALHFLSARWQGPFVQVNCAALPETLIESELFGHEAGAFTGAVKARPGRFELADGGSLFMDEIANATSQAQEKVLRVVEYGVFERVGGDRTRRVDARLIGATNVDLPSAADAGRFRHDLLDRLAFDVLTVPPLRARRDDIPLLADHFARAIAGELGWDGFPGFDRGAARALLDYDWPGNVRELRNVVERAVYRHPHPERPVEAIVFDPFDSPYRPASPAVTDDEAAQPTRSGADAVTMPDARLPIDLRASVAAVEKGLLEQGLGAARFNQAAAARHFGLSYHQLRHRLVKHGLI